MPETDPSLLSKFFLEAESRMSAPDEHLTELISRVAKARASGLGTVLATSTTCDHVQDVRHSEGSMANGRRKSINELQPARSSVKCESTVRNASFSESFGAKRKSPSNSSGGASLKKQKCSTTDAGNKSPERSTEQRASNPTAAPKTVARGKILKPALEAKEKRPTLKPITSFGTKPRLKIPRYSEIKRTYKDGRPRAPVDINLAFQRVASTRNKIEEKQLCDTNGIDMTEFIERLYEFYDAEEMKRRSKKTKYLSGTVVFFCPLESGKIGMNARKRLQILAQHGATILPSFDSTKITHIIWHQGNANERTLLERLGLKSLEDIPDHIPILQWKWVEDSERKQGLAPCHKYPALPSRVTYPSDYVPSPVKQKPPVVPPPVKKQQTRRADPDSDSNDSGDEKICDWAELLERDTPPTNGTDIQKAAVDPLAEFYDQAREEIDREFLNGCDDEDCGPEQADKEPRVDNEVLKKGVFQCDRKPTNTKVQACPNQDVIDTLSELKALHEAKGTPEDKWRVFSYQKAMGPLRLYKKRIESEAEARSISGVGDKTAKKIMEIIRTGSLRRINYERTQDVYTVLSFQGIYGVGQKTAHQWYANGARSLDDIRDGKYGIKLTTAQRIGLKFYDDINSRMPRNEAKEIFGIIKEIALQMDPHLFIDIMGSYRRGKDTCGDIDILITRPTSDGKTHAGILQRLLESLRSRNVITEDLSVPEDWDDLELCYRGLCRRDGLGKQRRIDFLTVPYESRGAALLYYTGDDIFNRSMRLKANKMGYSLNQRGLYKDVIRDPSDRRKKLHKGTILASETEREIFDILDVPWQEPHERIRN